MGRVLVLGTRNQKKLGELMHLLAPLGIELQSLTAYPHAIEVAETGTTFAENAALKATQQAMHLNRWVLGEDSGLSVAALHGAPGVYSARFSGPQATDEKNNDLLLSRLTGVPVEQRQAHYTCHAALSDPQGKIHTHVEAYCHGRIRSERAGSGGFGYDPLFEVVEYGQTFGELSASVKSQISHRAQAMQQLFEQIRQLIAAGHWPEDSQ
jgi:XTP/dITP diphosphohydrolase